MVHPIQFERERSRSDVLTRASRSMDGVRFDAALSTFVEKYIHDYRLKSSTADLLRQRANRLNQQLGEVRLATIDTRALREAIAPASQFEQSKLKSLLGRFFRYAISIGTYPSFPNPVDNERSTTLRRNGCDG